MAKPLAVAADGYLYGDAVTPTLALASDGFLLVEEEAATTKKRRLVLPAKGGGAPPQPLFPEQSPLIAFDLTHGHYRAVAVAMGTVDAPLEERIAAAIALLDTGTDDVP